MNDLDHFAAAALTGLLAADRNETMQDIIIEAWDYAEKMMIRKHIEDEG